MITSVLKRISLKTFSRGMKTWQVISRTPSVRSSLSLATNRASISHTEYPAKLYLGSSIISIEPEIN
jgi:hypothetical protein